MDIHVMYRKCDLRNPSTKNTHMMSTMIEYSVIDKILHQLHVSPTVLLNRHMASVSNVIQYVRLLNVVEPSFTGNIIHHIELAVSAQRRYSNQVPIY